MCLFVIIEILLMLLLSRLGGLWQLLHFLAVFNLQGTTAHVHERGASLGVPLEYLAQSLLLSVLLDG
jgi:hypothetical protein